MVNDLLPTLGALTLGGSAAVVLFALTSRASRTRYGARWRCWIWVLLCLRLAVPYSLLPHIDGLRKAPIQLSTPSDTVIYEYTPAQPDATPSPGVQGENQGNQSGAAEQTPLPAASASADSMDEQPGTQADEAPYPSAEKEFSISLSQVIVCVWLAGAVFYAAWTLISHVRFLRYLRRWSQPMRDADTIRLYNLLGDQLKLNHRPNLRTCGGLCAPMLAGLFHPVILLPEDSPTGDTMRYALLHELTHYKRGDIWLKTLALLANIVHWFNPFMWYMVRLVERDTELACDEAALRQLPPEEHAAYGRTILVAVERLKSNWIPPQERSSL